MKRYLFFFFIFLTSVSLFFSFNHEVKADTVDFIIPDTTFNNYSLLTPEFISYIDNYLNTNYPSYKNYYFLQSQSNGRIVLYAFSFGIYMSPNISTINNPSILQHNAITRLYCSFNSDMTSISSCSSGPYAVGLTQSSYLLYNHGDYINLDNCNDITFVYKNGDNSYTWSCVNGLNTPPSIEFLYNYWNSTPPDDTPILTSFVNLVINKLSYICEFITSSYIYLSIIVVFILYISILLLRRLL